ncbi:MAG: hypothetical protein JKY54_04465 [Flavobacteriales bacterium]|nr:hypothetical protein [Flavobacteriales bacterium]
MEETRIETLDSDEQLAPSAGKPKFLKILCILSFISGGFMVLFSGLGLLFEGSIIGLMEQAKDMVQTDVEEITFQHFIENYQFSLGLTLIGYTVSLIAVYLMNKLKKIGFHIYTATHILMVALPAILVELPEELDSGIGGVLLGSIGTVAFIVMYGLNLKHMKS